MSQVAIPLSFSAKLFSSESGVRVEIPESGQYKLQIQWTTPITDGNLIYWAKNEQYQVHQIPVGIPEKVPEIRVTLFKQISAKEIRAEWRQHGPGKALYVEGEFIRDEPQDLFERTLKELMERYNNPAYVYFTETLHQTVHFA